MRYLMLVLLLSACTPVVETTWEPDPFHIKYQSTDLSGNYQNLTIDVYYDGFSNMRIRTFGIEATEDFIIDGNRAHCQIRQYATMCALLAENVSEEEVAAAVSSYTFNSAGLEYLGEETHAGLPTKCYLRGEEKVCLYKNKLLYSKNTEQEIEAILYEETIPSEIMVAPR